MSRTPGGDNPTNEYLQGWESLKRMIIEENASWSGSERNLVYLNMGDGLFCDVSSISGADCIGDGRSLVATDWDDDGKLDFLLRNRTAPRLQLFRNQVEDRGNFVALDLRGTKSNRDAIGAHVTVVAGGRELKQTLHAGDGFLAQSSKRMHFGLGGAETIDRIEVHWPSGARSVFDGPEANGRYLAVEGAAELEPVAARTLARFATLEPAPLARDTSGIPRLDLREKVPMAPIVVPSFENAARRAGDLQGGPVLLNLWSTTCANCLKEFKAFHEERERIRESGLRIVTLCADAGSAGPRVNELLGEFGLEEDAGYVDAQLSGVLQILFELVIGSRETIPLPMSLLLDEKAQLVALYFGRVDLEQLMADVSALQRMNADDLSDVSLAPGVWLVRAKRSFGGMIKALREDGQDSLANFYRKVSRERP